MPDTLVHEKDEGRSIREFFARELPPKKAKQASRFSDAAFKASERYRRHAEKKHEWYWYSDRRSRLREIEDSSKALVCVLCNLDVLTREEFSNRLDPDAINSLVGSLTFLHKETLDLAGQLPKKGKPRDIAQERWILQLAEIFESAFRRPARVWGSADGTMEGRFYRLMEAACPEGIPQDDKLSVRQINRLIKNEKEKNLLKKQNASRTTI